MILKLNISQMVATFQHATKVIVLVPFFIKMRKDETSWTLSKIQIGMDANFMPDFHVDII